MIENQCGFDDIHRQARRGSALAQRILGQKYLCGEDVPKDYRKAVKWLSRAAARDECRAEELMQLHLQQAAQHSSRDDLEFLKAAAAEDVVEAQKLLADKYFFGNGVQRNYRRAAEWLNRAASYNEPEAQELLRRIDAFRLGVHALVQPHLQQAARRRNPSDLEFLCLAIEKGICQAQKLPIEDYYDYYSAMGVQRDYRQTAEWLSRAASRSLVGAEELMQQHLRHAKQHSGHGDLEFLTAAAEGGVGKAQKLLADKYLFGNGVQCDYRYAVELYLKATRQAGADKSLKKAAQRGHSAALRRLAKKPKRPHKTIRKPQTTSQRRRPDQLPPGSTGSADT